MMKAVQLLAPGSVSTSTSTPYSTSSGPGFYPLLPFIDLTVTPTATKVPSLDLMRQNPLPPPFSAGELQGFTCTWCCKVPSQGQICSGFVPCPHMQVKFIATSAFSRWLCPLTLQAAIGTSDVLGLTMSSGQFWSRRPALPLTPQFTECHHHQTFGAGS